MTHHLHVHQELVYVRGICLNDLHGCCRRTMDPENHFVSSDGSRNQFQQPRNVSSGNAHVKAKDLAKTEPSSQNSARVIVALALVSLASAGGDCALDRAARHGRTGPRLCRDVRRWTKARAVGRALL